MIAANLHTIKARIAQLSQHYGVPAPQLLAVSKKHPLSAIETAIAEGQRHFGESYVQEAVEKIQTLNNPDIIWHFIGPIQSNKTKAIASHFDWVHSVDREKIAQRLNDQRPDTLPPLKIFLQVNLDNEPQKSGFTPEALPNAICQILTLPKLTLHGLMAIPKSRGSLAAQRAAFAQLRDLLATCQAHCPGMTDLSMGMSNDIEAAIAEGSNWLRIGTAVFGARA